MKYTEEELIEIIGYQKQKEQDRNTIYETIDNVTDNSLYVNRLSAALGTTEIPASQIQYLLINWLRIKERDSMSLTTLPPEIKYLPPFNSGQFGPLWSQLLTAATRDKWRKWRMAMMIDKISQSASRYDVICGGLHPDFSLNDGKDKDVMAMVYNPKNCYAERRLGTHGELLYFLHIVTGTGRQIADMYPQVVNMEGFIANSDEYEVITFSDENDKVIIINNNLVKRNGVERLTFKGGKVPGVGIEHNLGFNPNFVVPITESSKTLFGIPTRYFEIPISEMYNDFLALEHIFKRMGMGFFVEVVNPNKVPDDIKLGKPAIIEVGEGGGVNIKHTMPPSAPNDQELVQLEHITRVNNNVVPGRSGIAQSSVSTGRSESALMTGVGDDAEAMKKRMGYFIATLDEMALKMDKQLFPNIKRTVFPKWNGKTEEFSYQPKDLPDPTMHELIWNPFGPDVGTRLVNGLQMVGAGTMSIRTFLEMQPGIDVEEELRRLEEDQDWKLKLQIKMMEAQARLTQQSQMGAMPESQSPQAVESAMFSDQKMMESA